MAVTYSIPAVDLGTRNECDPSSSNDDTFMPGPYHAAFLSILFIFSEITPKKYKRKIIIIIGLRSHFNSK